MFFYLSKIFWFFIQPLNFSIFLLFLALLAFVLAWRRTAFLATLTAFLILGAGAWTTAGALMLHPLEDRFSRPQNLPDQIAGIIVLGGGFEGGINLVRGGYGLNASGDRFVETAVLARRFPEAKVVVTGGTGALLLDGEGDAATAPRLLTALGVPPERLLLENESRNTHENAVFTKRLVNAQPGETWLLVTSAFHMPRSMGLFRRAGFDVVPWPADYRTSGREKIGIAEDNPYDSLSNLNVGLREWIGLLAYWWTGKIDEILPG